MTLTAAISFCYFQVGKSHSFLFHSACIWGLETYPAALGDGKKAVRHLLAVLFLPDISLTLLMWQVLPPGSFITCGSDDTVRIWNMDTTMPANTLYR